ncbi:MAG: phosphoribosyltransferase [Rhodothalassiaceae bacterium]
MEKLFIRAEDLLRDSLMLGIQVLKSDFRPSYIVGIWRGGAPVGISVQEVLAYYNVPTDHIAIRTSSYGPGMVPAEEVQVSGMNYVIDTIEVHDRLLIVDDVFDSGRSVEAVIRELKRKCRRNTPEDIRVATVYYKPEKNKTDRVPDFYIHKTDTWLVFPHELQGLSLDELRQHKPLPPEAYEVMVKA